jgi:flavin reductase (DIM6/NTAB) family NADH-FMN oxidoreductase RutF
MALMSRSLDTVHELVSELDYPMFIVTVAAAGERAGCLVGFATQCSIDPPRFLVCLSDKNMTYRVAQGADAMIVHLVPRGAEGLAELFGSQTGDAIDKFERCRWRTGPRGIPVLEDCGNWFAGRVLDRMDAGRARRLPARAVRGGERTGRGLLRLSPRPADGAGARGVGRAD